MSTIYSLRYMHLEIWLTNNPTKIHKQVLNSIIAGEVEFFYDDPNPTRDFGYMGKFKGLPDYFLNTVENYKKSI